MIIDQSAAHAFWLSVGFALVSLAFATFLFAWSRNRVQIWQKHTYRRYRMSKKGEKSIRRRLESKADETKGSKKRRKKSSNKMQRKKSKMTKTKSADANSKSPSVVAVAAASKQATKV